jgi:hypothetical protein
MCESEIHRNVTLVRTFRASLFSRGKLILRLQKNSQHLNESLKDSRDSEGRDWEQTVKIQNYQPSLPPMLILPGPSLLDDDSVVDRRTDNVILAHADYEELICVYAPHFYRAL